MPHQPVSFASCLLALCLAGCGGGGPAEPGMAEGPQSIDSADDTSVSVPTRAVAVAGVGGSAVVVRAKATLAGGIGARMAVYVDGIERGTADVLNTGSYQDYVFAAPAALGAGSRVDVAFTNDGVTTVQGVRTEDRNLLVESIAVDGGPALEATATGVVLDKGEGTAAFDGVDVLPGQRGLWWNGALRFVLPNPGPSVPALIVHARASLAGGVGAIMVVRLDGQSLGQVTVANVGAAQAYRFPLPKALGAAASVDVLFTNDGITMSQGVKTEDRNLYVESIAIEGSASISPADKGVLLDKGEGAAATDGVDVLPGQNTLAWNGALRFMLAAPPLSDTLFVKARGVAADGVLPQIQVYVRGRESGGTGSVEIPEAGTTVSVPVRLYPDSRVDIRFVNPGRDTATGISRTVVLESIRVGSNMLLSPTAPGAVFDRGSNINPPYADVTAAAPWNDGLLTRPGSATLSEEGALRLSLARMRTPEPAAGTPAAAMSTAQKFAATRMAYEVLASRHPLQASLLHGNAAHQLLSPLTLSIWPTLPAAPISCPRGGGLDAWVNGSVLGVGQALPVEGQVRAAWSACATEASSMDGTTLSSYVVRRTPVNGPYATTSYRTSASMEAQGPLRWTEFTAPSASGDGSGRPALDMSIQGRMGLIYDSLSSRTSTGQGWLRWHGTNVIDHTLRTTSSVDGVAETLGSSSDDGVNGYRQVIVPAGLRFQLDGIAYEIEGFDLAWQNSGNTLRLRSSTIDLIVKRDGALVGHLVGWGSAPVIEVDGQTLPW